MENSNTLTIIDNANIEAVQETLNKIVQFQSIVKNTLKKDLDYGIIPRCNKPSLLKPGAEKITMLLGLQTKFEIVSQQSDVENGFFRYQIKCTLLKNNEILTEGFGSANTKESKYIKQNPFTIDNTILKMAKKRALVDAVLLVASLSEIFTQDIEDIGITTTTTEVTEKQLKRLFALQKNAGVTEEQIKDYLLKKFKIDSRNKLNKLQYEKLCNDLDKQAKFKKEAS
jgi:hypothetical protein